MMMRCGVPVVVDSQASPISRATRKSRGGLIKNAPSPPLFFARKVARKVARQVARKVARKITWLENGDQYHADDDTGHISAGRLLIGVYQVFFASGLLSIDANSVQR